VGQTIENPVINSPFVEPAQHFRTLADGTVTGEIEPRRRPSEFFVPVARPKRISAAQLTMDGFGGPRKQQPNEIVNEIRQAVGRWRIQGYPHTTSITRELLAYWRADDRERRLFFCQLEAAETAIYLTEAAERMGDTKALNVIRAENARLNGGLSRLAFKMATGSGKTVVMAMLIAWQTLNKLANPQDKRFSTNFLVITPGITIRDRLRVLLPNDPATFFRTMDIVTPEQLDRLQAATIVITNFHTLIRREKLEAASLTKKVLVGLDGDTDRFKETAAEMVRRVCADFGHAKNLIVINDEAHHCYALLKKTGSGNLFMVFGEPDIDVRAGADGKLTVEIRGLDVYDPTTGAVRSSSVADIASWFLDTSYDGESFFVRHAYFIGADDPYERLRKALKADISPEAWDSINSTISRPFPRPTTGRVAVKVINHYGDEVMKVFRV